MSVTIRPISTFPPPETPNHRRVRSQFKTSTGATMDQLRAELAKLRARDVVIEIDVTDADLRITDGWLRADARPRTPRVVVSFTHPVAGPVRYPADRFLQWQDNLRAITLSLEALRAVDRYGVTRHAEQYAGWKALPSSTTATKSVDWAVRHLLMEAGRDDMASAVGGTIDAAAAKVLVRDARRRTHPDTGGSVERFTLIQEAAALLSARLGQTL